MKHDPVKTFDPTVFAEQTAIDDLLRKTIYVTIAIAGVVALFMPSLGIVSSFVAPAVMLGLWLWLSISTNRAARMVAMTTELSMTDPTAAQLMAGQVLRVRPTMRWVQLLAYHRLAGLKHLERRFAETAAICLCVLGQPLKGPAAAVRPHLLLMLAEAQLELNNLPGAYHALAHLQQTKLSLAQALQRLAIQTRYELAVGAYDAALQRSRSKVELAELMPAPHCAAMHAMLATAAHHDGQPRLANWLWERTRLLAPPTLLEQLEHGGFGINIVEHHEPGNPAPA